MVDRSLVSRNRRCRALRAFLGGPAARRPRCARAQPARRRSRPAARQPDRLHRAVGFGEVEPGVRHDLRRGPAPVRRVVERVRPAVPRADGQAGRRLHRGPVPGGVDRPEVDEPQPALDRRHDHRGARLPEVALRPRRRAALPGLRARDREADPPADRGPGAGHAGGHPLPGAGSGGAHPQGRVRRPVRDAADAGLLPGAGRRHGAPAQRPADAEEAGEARHLGDRRPAVGQGERQAAPDRLGGDGPATGRRAGRARLRRPARTTTRIASGGSPSAWRARTGTRSRWTTSSRARSPSTRPTVPAPSAPASGSRRRSTRTWWSPTPS